MNHIILEMHKSFSYPINAFNFPSILLCLNTILVKEAPMSLEEPKKQVICALIRKKSFKTKS